MEQYEIERIVNDKIADLRYDLERQIDQNDREVRDMIRNLSVSVDERIMALWAEMDTNQ